MPLIRDYGLKDLDAAAKFVAMTFDELGDVVGLVPDAWKEMEYLRTEGRMVSVRGYLMEYAAAAYARQDGEAFRRSCDVLVAYTMAKSSLVPPAASAVVPPAAGMLSFDLAVAISRGNIAAAREVATVILAAVAPENGHAGEAEARSAVVLSALADLDYGRAEAAAAVLKERCLSKDLDRLDSMIYGHWADAALGIARRDPTPTIPAFRSIAHVQRVYIGRELARWSKGQHTELSPLDFWDWTSTALAGVARGFGYDLSSGDESWTAFADAEWTCGRGVSENPPIFQDFAGRS